MAQLRGVDILGQGVLNGIPGLADTLAKHFQDQRRRQELNTIVQGLLARSQGTPQKMGTDIGSLPIPAQAGVPMYSQQNFGDLQRMSELTGGQGPKLLQDLQPRTQFMPGFRGAIDVGQVSPSGETTLKNIRPPLPEDKSTRTQWPLIKTEKATGPMGQSGTTYFYGDPETKQVYKTEFHSLGGAATSGPGTPKSRQDLIDKFNRDPNIRAAVKVNKAANELIDLANSNNPVSNNAIATIAARASGEVGNLSEADKAPFGGSQAILDRLKQIAATGYSGLRTPENKSFIIGLAEAFKNSGLQMKESLADDWANQYSTGDTGLGTYEQIFGYLFPKKSKSNQPSQSVPNVELTGRDKQAYEWAKANPNDPRSAKILEKLGRK